MITASDITPETLVSKLFDRAWRTEFCGALAQEQGSRLPLINAFSEAATCAQATPEQLRELVEVLIDEDHDELVAEFVHHPEMPLDVLMALCDEGRCIDQLGHRAGPRELLERVIEKHQYPEAILTMALELYGDPKVQLDEFTAFVRRHSRNDWMMRTLAQVDASERPKELKYEKLLDGHDEAIAFHAFHLARSSRHDVEHLRHFLECFPLPKALARLIEVDGITQNKQELIENLSASHSDHPDVAAALLLRDRIEQANDEELSSTTAEELFATDAPQILVALAGNQHTPLDILERLSIVHEITQARLIRNRARETLRRLKSKRR